MNIEGYDKQKLADFYKAASSKCHWMEIADDGTICEDVIVEPNQIERVSVNKNGDTYIEWRRNASDLRREVCLDAIDSTWHSSIKGMFTSVEAGKEIAKKHFFNLKIEMIAKLESELKELKDSLAKYHKE